MTELKNKQFTTTTFIPNVSREDVWARISSWQGVNAELSPEFKMTFPAQFKNLEDVPADGIVHFTSTILLFGFLPVDRHNLSIIALKAPDHFDERSSNFAMKVWTHKRSLFAHDGGVTVTDECAFVPRIGLVGPLLHGIFAGVFKRRHQRLKRFFAQ